MYKIKTFIMLVLFAVLVLPAACKKTDERLIQQKLDLRQRMDEMILEIDRALEKMHDKMTIQDSMEKQRTKEDIKILKSLRTRMDSTLDEVNDVSGKAWMDFKQKTDTFISHSDSTVEEILFDPNENAMNPYVP